MGFLDDIQEQVVGLDTAPLIYFMEKHPIYHPVVRPLFEALAEGQFTAVTSTITLLETMVQPLRLNQGEVAQQYQDILLQAENLTTYALSPAIAAKAAAFRAEYNFRTPDAIQLATAVSANAQFFLTNDHALKKFSHLQIVTVDDLL